VSAPARRAVERYVEAYRTGDVSQLADIIAEEFVNHTLPAYSGRDGVARGIAALHTGFSDVSVVVEQCVCEGDSAAFRAVVEATHTGPFAGRAATGRRIRFVAADFVRLRDGRFVELWTLQAPPSLLIAIDAPA
jgi:predicted ester cyclase